jgi:DNA-binding response OmpR family regulator
MVSGSLPLLRDRNEEDLDRVDLLAKPFAFNELLRKVRRLCGRHRSSAAVTTVAF